MWKEEPTSCDFIELDRPTELLLNIYLTGKRSLNQNKPSSGGKIPNSIVVLLESCNSKFVKRTESHYLAVKSLRIA